MRGSGKLDYSKAVKSERAAQGRPYQPPNSALVDIKTGSQIVLGQTAAIGTASASINQSVTSESFTLRPTPA